MSKLLTAIHEWRATPAAVLPLALFQAITTGMHGLAVMYLMRDIRCSEYPAPHVPEIDICSSPAVQKAYTVDTAIYTTVSTVISIIVSGPYGTLSDLKGRKRAMALGIWLNAIAFVWIAFCCE